MPRPGRRSGQAGGWSGALAAAVLAALLAAACGDASSGGSSSSATPATTAPAAAASVTEAATTAAATTSAGAPTAFTSGVYRYALTVPAGWQTTAAKQAWDGTKPAPTEEAPQSDVWTRPDGASAFATAAPTTKRLAGYATEWIARVADEHGDTCPHGPVSRGPVTIGSDPGVLLAWDCGILINIAVAVRDGTGYAFTFRDPGVHAATDPTDRADFARLLQSVTFRA